MKGSTGVLHPISISQVIVNFAARHGVDADTCLLGTGIQNSQLQDPEALIEREQEMRLIENLILALPNMPAIGFELGLQYNVSTFGVWGFALRTSRTLREAIQRAIRYLPLSTAYCRISIFYDAEMFGVLVDPTAIPQHLRQFLLERDIATAINIVQELGLAGVEIQTLEFTGSTQPYASRIATLCGVHPRYGCAQNMIMVRLADADRPLAMYDARLTRMLEDQCKIQLDRRQIVGLTGKVREQLLGQMGLVASLEDVAEHLALSPRSLRRKLEDEGTTFRGLVDHERKLLAAQLLETTQMKLDELGLQLGYADTASFTRAFRRWYGTSPGEFRSQRAQDE